MAFKFNKKTSTAILSVAVSVIGIVETILSDITESKARAVMKEELKNELLEELKIDE